MENKYITVAQLTRYIKYKIDNDVNLEEVYLKGEISNFKAHSRGHFYFTLKDEESRIAAIMFASSAKNVKFMPQDGMKVLVKGKISVYPANGTYQIYVNEMLEDGLGNLYIAFEQLKKRLGEEGLFNPEHKKLIPKIPERIGVVTAPTGAAIRDITSTIKRRWPYAKVYLFPALVQGDGAKESITKKIKQADDYNLDVLIVGRGGGSIEDLWAFNEEMVARAIYNAKTPIISAVGHEVDFTIADFVSDMRAPTPTGAAEMSVPNKSDVERLLMQINARLIKDVNSYVEIRKNKLSEIMNHHIFKDPMNMVEIKEEKFSNLLDKLKYNITSLYKSRETEYIKLKESIIFKKPLSILDNDKNKFNLIVTKLDTLSPLKTIKRGYSITKKDGKVLTSVKGVNKKDKLEVEVSDGNINVEVI